MVLGYEFDWWGIDWFWDLGLIVWSWREREREREVVILGSRFDCCCCKTNWLGFLGFKCLRFFVWVGYIFLDWFGTLGIWDLIIFLVEFFFFFGGGGGGGWGLGVCFPRKLLGLWVCWRSVWLMGFIFIFI